MITGHCECGEVKYQAKGEINDYSHCHCSQCRRMHGAPFVTFAGVERRGFRYLQGEASLSSYVSSESHNRYFCPNCGSNILVELSIEPESLYLAMGTVDGNPEHPPAYHIFVGSKAPWHSITDTAPQYDTVPEDE